jgi:hypothetical protein
VDSKRLGAVLALAYEKQYSDFAEALLTPGLGPRTLQALALVAEVIYGAAHRFSDPARFSFAHGGKDGHPFPVPTNVYDETIRVLQRAVEKARLARSEKLEGMRKLAALARALECGVAPLADVEATIARERGMAHFYGGRTVTGAAEPTGVAEPQGAARPKGDAEPPRAAGPAGAGAEKPRDRAGGESDSSSGASRDRREDYGQLELF